MTLASDFGKMSERWSGMDIAVNARLEQGILLQGGLSFGRTSLDVCEVRAKVPEMTLASPFVINPTAPDCDVVGNYLTQVKFLGTYTIAEGRRAGGGDVPELPGPNIVANYIAPTPSRSRRSGVPCRATHRT